MQAYGVRDGDLRHILGAKTVKYRQTEGDVFHGIEAEHENGTAHRRHRAMGPRTIEGRIGHMEEPSHTGRVSFDRRLKRCERAVDILGHGGNGFHHTGHRGDFFVLLE